MSLRPLSAYACVCVGGRVCVKDFAVSWGALAIMIFVPDASNSVIVLRLMRVFRILTVLSRSENLTIMIAGLLSGISSVGYIMTLLIIIFYVFAIVGFYVFGGNDPVRFGSLGAAMLTLMQCSTLSSWEEVFFTQAYGCDVYPSTSYGLASKAGTFETHWGSFPEFTCDNPGANAVRSVSPSPFPCHPTTLPPSILHPTTLVAHSRGSIV